MIFCKMRQLLQSVTFIRKFLVTNGFENTHNTPVQSTHTQLQESGRCQFTLAVWVYFAKVVDLARLRYILQLHIPQLLHSLLALFALNFGLTSVLSFSFIRKTLARSAFTEMIKLKRFIWKTIFIVIRNVSCIDDATAFVGNYCSMTVHRTFPWQCKFSKRSMIGAYCIFSVFQQLVLP